MYENEYVRSVEDGKLHCRYCDAIVGQLHDEECPVVRANMEEFEQRGKRYNTGKCPKHLRPLDVDNEVCWNYGYGANKYGEGDWKKGQPASESYACARRHMDKFMAREDIDPETGLNHLAAAITNLEMMLWHSWHTWPNRPEFDDRPQFKLVTQVHPDEREAGMRG